MERLTHERSNGIKPGYWSPATKEELVQRLAAYENTGYAPDEITAAIEQARREGETRSDDCLEALQAAMDRLGKFGRLFADYSGCPRGPMGRMAGVSLVDEALTMPEIVDVDGGRWIPVQADVLRELCDLATSHWISVKEQLPKAFASVIVCREGAEKGSVKVEQGCLDVNGWWKVYGTRTKHVTHWMPMPEPQKE